MRVAPLAAAGLLTLAACAPARAASATVAVTDVTIALATASGCTPIVSAHLTSSADTELLGATTPPDVAAGVSLHIAAGGPRLGGHEGHLDGDGKRRTSAQTSVTITRGTPAQLSPTDSYLVVDGPVHSLTSGDVMPLTFRFSNAPDVTVRASVTSSGC
jgi:copper(I)-binding protein